MLPLLIAALLMWAGRRQSRADRMIQEMLAALTRAGEPVTALDLAKMFPPPPPERDAMRFFSNAMFFAELNRPPFAFTPIVGSPTPARTERMTATARAALETFYTNTASLSNVLSAVPAGARFGTHWEVGIFEAPVVPFVKVRSLIQLLGARALYAAEAGDAEGASEMLVQGFQFSGALSADGSLVEHMIRNACLSLTCSVAERSLNQVRFNDEQLARILTALPPPDTNALANTLRVEHCMAIYLFSEVKKGRRLDDVSGSKTTDPWWKRAWKRVRSWRREYSDDDFIAYLEMMPRLRRSLEAPASQTVPEFTRHISDYATNIRSEAGGAIVPNWTKAVTKDYEIAAQVEGIRCALAIERFRLAHAGQRPLSLPSLVPSFIPAVPRDPFDHQPLRFKPLTNGYVVYSVGLDGIDNGGLEKTNTAIQTNCDITVTVER